MTEPLRAVPDQAVMRQLEIHEAELAISSIVWHELLVGCLRLPDSKKRLAVYTQHLVLITFNTGDFSSFKGLRLMDWRKH